MATTTRWNLPYPELDGIDPADVPFWMNALAVSLDGVAMDDQGTLANRPVSTAPSPGKRGRYYMVVGDSTPANNGILWRDNGTGWDPVGYVADDSITAAQIAANAVGASELADNAVDTAAIAASAVTSAKIADGTIVTADIADGQITSVKIADGTLVDADFAAGAALALSKLATIPVIGQSNAAWRIQVVTSPGSSTSARAVTYPVAFSAVPMICPGWDGSAGSLASDMGITAVTASGFTWTNGGASGATYKWIAFGPA